jgi:hypothetical protein
MAETHIISALTRKRATLSGEIKHYEKLLKETKTSLSSIDNTIHLFDESYDLRTIKAKRITHNRYFKVGEAKIAILDTLRDSKEPMRTDTLSEVIAFDKGLSSDAGFDDKNFQKTIVSSLANCEQSGLVQNSQIPLKGSLSSSSSNDSLIL